MQISRFYVGLLLCSPGSCCHTHLWKYSKLNLLLKLSLTKKLRSQAEPSSRHHRLTGWVRANARLDPDTELLRGIVQKLTLLLLNILVNICCQQGKLRNNILFADKSRIRVYCYTKKTSPLKSEIFIICQFESSYAGEDKDYINEEVILSHPYMWHFSQTHSTQ